MKQPKKLTRKQKEVVLAYGYNPDNWMLVEEMDFYIKIIHKESKRVKMIDKFLTAKK